MTIKPDHATLQPGEVVLFVDAKEREYLRTLKPRGRISLRGGPLSADEIIGLPEGSRVSTTHGETFLVFRPTYAHLIPNLPRRAQVIYPKDVGVMLLWGDAFPGAKIVEVGAGPGALTIALLRAIGPTGTLLTVEMRADFCTMSRENVRHFFGAETNWLLVRGDAYMGIPIRNADRFFVDVPEPWRVAPIAATILRPGGVFVGYVPTVVQVKALVDELRTHQRFAAIEVMENLLRFWHVKDLSVRPEHRMVAHTGFIVVARVTAG
jgi:tRNA (adenine57-N1/adenine58-N1)-methyltransferase catalytic subunit